MACKVALWLEAISKIVSRLTKIVAHLLHTTFAKRRLNASEDFVSRRGCAMQSEKLALNPIH